MSIANVKDRAAEEIATILSSSFSVDVTKTSAVPHSADGAITFPNLDTATQRSKLIETAVLYVDIRRSTELNLQHKPHTVAKLYSAFVRAMTQCAAEYRGHVRGIIGDRLMVLFNPSTAFADAVNTAILMNSMCKYVLNQYFKANDVSCGIGIDYGRMLVTKTGVRRQGVEQHNYKSLVWLGRPANIASKLTDQANKSTTYSRTVVVEARQKYTYNGFGSLGLMDNPLLAALQNPPNALTGLFGSSIPVPETTYHDVEVSDFLSRLSCDYISPNVRHRDDQFRSFRVEQRSSVRSTPPILMTQAVYDGFRRACPDDLGIKNRWWKVVGTSVPTRVYGGDVHFKAFKS